MAVYYNRVSESSTTTGTGTMTLAGAVTGYCSFASVIATSATVNYTITDASGNWEVGIGTYTSSGTTLTRTIVLASSAAVTATLNPSDASGSLTFSNGNLTITCTTGNATDALVRATVGVAVGSVACFEATYGAAFTGNDDGIGIANATQVLNNYVGSSANSIGFFGQASASNIYTAAVTVVSGLPAASANSTIGVIVDNVNQMIGFRVENGRFHWWSFSALGSVTVYPTVSVEQTDSITVNFGASPFKYPFPGNGFGDGLMPGALGAAKVSWAAGTKTVFLDAPAQALVTYDTGAGEIAFNTSLGPQVSFLNIASSNYLTMQGGAAGTPGTVTIGADGASTNVNINITPKGTGKVEASGVPLTAIASTEVDFGSTPLSSKTFTVTDANINTGHVIMMNQSGAAATGKSQDENEFDLVDFTCLAGSGSFTAYAFSQTGPVIGKFKAFYSYG